MNNRQEQIEQAKRLIATGISKELVEVLHQQFPELKESEEERIRKALLRCCDDWDKGQFGCMAKEDVPAIRAYLERQKEKKPSSYSNLEITNVVRKALQECEGFNNYRPDVYAARVGATVESLLQEQKPTEWSEEDEYVINKVLNWAEIVNPTSTIFEKLPKEQFIERLKSLPERFNLRSKQGWSEDFEENIRMLLHNKLTWHSEDGSMSSTVFIDDKTLKDIVSGIWFYVGKEALKYPNKEIHVQEWSEEDEDKVDDICKLIEYATIIPRSGDDDTGIPPTRLNDKYKGELKAFVKSLRPQPKSIISDTDKSNLKDAPAIIRKSNHPFKENIALIIEKYL